MKKYIENSNIKEDIKNFKNNPEGLMKYILLAVAIVFGIQIFLMTIQLLFGVVWISMRIMAMILAVLLILYIGNWIHENVIKKNKE